MEGENLDELYLERGVMRVEQYDEVRDGFPQIKEQIIEVFTRNELTMW
jgi:hypothetical protein